MSRVTFSPRASRQVDAADDWWRANREAAPLLFGEELNRAVRLLASNPEIGSRYPRPRHPNARRVILIRTRYHVYYEYHRKDDEVWVMDVWSAVRGQDPPL